MFPKTLVALCVVCLTASVTSAMPVPASDVQVWFSPAGGCTNACVTALNAARRSIFVQAYSFTSLPIARALVAAKRRGVHVEVVLDKSQRSERYSEADFTAHAGIPTYIDAAHAIAHNKVMVVDSEVVLTGSFNFTSAAEQKNAENLLEIRDPQLAARYLQNWHQHRDHSQLYRGR